CPPRRTPPSSSPSTTRSARRRSTCARPSARARRKSGRRLPATSRWTGPDWRRIPTPMRARSIASSHPPRTWRALPSSIKGSWCNRWSRAVRPRATIRRTTATTCAAARKARARCATGLLPSWAFNQRLRVVTEDVGGAFGLKTGPYPEYLAILVAARKLGRPVHWMSNRAEAFLSDNHARDAFSEVELALDERGKFLGLRVRHLGNMGAYIGAVGANIQTVNLTRCLPGMYDIPRIDMGLHC